MPRHSPRPTGGRRRSLRSDERDCSRSPNVLPPVDLTAPERAAWERYAPGALAMRTLTRETSEGFRLLVQTAVARDVAAGVLTAEGLMVAPGIVHPLTTHYRQLTQRLESLLAKFALVAPGRPVVKPKAEKADDLSKWAGILPQHGEDDDSNDFYTN